MASSRHERADEGRRTEQQARYSRLFHLTSAAKTRGCKTTSVRISDLEALIAIAALSDATLVVSP